jgi:transcriptional regulator with XRE-family HTH domain
MTNLREYLGYSEQQMAKRFDLTLTELRQIERNPWPFQVDLFASIYKCDPIKFDNLQVHSPQSYNSEVEKFVAFLRLRKEYRGTHRPEQVASDCN